MSTASLIKPGDRILTTSVRHHQPTFLNGYVTFVSMDDAYFIIKIRYAGHVARENAIMHLVEYWPKVDWERCNASFVTLEVWLPYV